LKPNITLAETKTPDGARMTLVEQDGNYCIRINGQQLMHSAVSASEVELGRLGCENHVQKTSGTRVLIGGLGLGFTLRSVLATVGGNAVVHVAELMPAIVAWNRTFLMGLNGGMLGDRRVSVLVEDVRASIRRAAHKPYDVITLDVDNGADGMVQQENNEIYSDPGLQQIVRALKPGGRVAVWSACPDITIERKLKRTGLNVRAVPARLYPQAKRSACMIYLADKTGEQSTRKRKS
jgi:spermidine synthase